MKETTAKLRECRWKPKLVSFTRGELISFDWRNLTPAQVIPWFCCKIFANDECFEERSEWLNPGHMTVEVGAYVLLCRLQHMKLEDWGEIITLYKK